MNVPNQKVFSLFFLHHVRMHAKDNLDSTVLQAVQGVMTCKGDGCLLTFQAATRYQDWHKQVH